MGLSVFACMYVFVCTCMCTHTHAYPCTQYFLHDWYVCWNKKIFPKSYWLRYQTPLKKIIATQTATLHWTQILALLSAERASPFTEQNSTEHFFSIRLCFFISTHIVRTYAYAFTCMCTYIHTYAWLKTHFFYKLGCAFLVKFTLYTGLRSGIWNSMLSFEIFIVPVNMILKLNAEAVCVEPQSLLESTLHV